MRCIERSAIVGALLLIVASSARAQTSHAELEARLDAIIAHRSAIQGALGADIPISPALHLELAAGIGPSLTCGGGSSISARGDAVVHFLLDPRPATRWSPYAGGGIGARYDRGPDWRAVAIVVAGVNAPKWKHAVPFIEAGLGGGVRLGAGLRRAP